MGPTTTDDDRSSPGPTITSVTRNHSVPFTHTTFADGSYYEQPYLDHKDVQIGSTHDSVIPSIDIEPSSFPVDSDPTTQTARGKSAAPVNAPWRTGQVHRYHLYQRPAIHCYPAYSVTRDVTVRDATVGPIRATTVARSPVHLPDSHNSHAYPTPCVVAPP